jgi:flagellar motor component MotA
MNKILFLAISLASLPVYAYIGPGMGGGVIAAVIGFFAAIVLGLWAILYFPIKRALKKRKEKKISSKELDNDSK